MRVDEPPTFDTSSIHYQRSTVNQLANLNIWATHMSHWGMVGGEKEESQIYLKSGLSIYMQRECHSREQETRPGKVVVFGLSSQHESGGQAHLRLASPDDSCFVRETCIW